MGVNEILHYCLMNFEDSVVVDSWGEKGVFYNPNNQLKRGVYVVTIKEKDGKNDQGSNLNRPDTFRVNLGVQKQTFIELFGELPERPKAGEVVSMDFNFTSVDKLIPHPVYAWMGWISIINPSKESFYKLEPLLQESYEYAKQKFNKRT